MNRKLLVADDSVTVQKVVDLTFSDEGYTVTAVSDGRRALEEIERDVPDVVLADVAMPGADGYEVCARIKRDARLRHVPVILLVGAFEPFNEAEAREVGADDVLTKPFQSIRAMVSKVGNLLSGSSGERTTDDDNTAALRAEEADQRYADRLAKSSSEDKDKSSSVETSALSTAAPDASDANLYAAESAGDSIHVSHPATGEFDTADDELINTSAAEPPRFVGTRDDSFGEDDQDIEITSLSEQPSREADEHIAVSASPAAATTDNVNNDLTIDEEANVYMPARPDYEMRDDASNATPGGIGGIAPRQEDTRNADPAGNQFDAASASAPSTRSMQDDDLLLDLEDVDSPSPQLATMSPSAASPFSDDDDGLLDLPDEPSPAADVILDAPDFYVEAEPVEVSSVVAEHRASPPLSSASEASNAMSARAATTPLAPPTKHQPATRITLDQLAPEVVEAIVQRVVEQLSERAIREIAWEVVPALAERMIKQRLETDERGL